MALAFKKLKDDKDLRTSGSPGRPRTVQGTRNEHLLHSSTQNIGYGRNNSAQEKHFAYYAEAAKLLGHAGGRTPILRSDDLVAQLLQQQQAELGSMLFNYDNSLVRCIRMINRNPSVERRRVSSLHPGHDLLGYEDRRNEAPSRMHCRSVDSAARERERLAHRQALGVKAGSPFDKLGIASEKSLGTEQERHRLTRSLERSPSKWGPSLANRPLTALRIDAHACQIVQQGASYQSEESEIEPSNRVSRAGRAIEHEDKPPEIEARMNVEDHFKLIETLQQQEAQHRADPEWRKKVKIIYDASKKGAVPPASVVGPHFSANFESGNLKRVTQVGHNEFDLQLCPDTNTGRHMQWYYFKVSGLRNGISYKINIVNLCKKDSLYNHGLRPLTYSEKRILIHGIGWARSCEKIGYFPSLIHYRRNGRVPFHTLTFRYTPEYDNDTVYFAHCYPYTTRQLYNDLALLEEKHKIMRKTILCQTPGGLDCPLIEITSICEDAPQNDEKKGIFICARVHPGESPSSYIMKGILEFLTSEDSRARKLRENYVFKLIPMLNPDGVVSGNTRSTLHGEDMNRHWRFPHKMKHATVCAARQLLEDFSKERPLLLNLDLHAHSRRCNIFAYGCPTPKEKRGDVEVRAGHERLFPRLLAEACEAFQYHSCSYKTAGKDETERVVLQSEYNVLASYTIEASFLGGNFGKYDNLHYTTADYIKFGHDICLAINEYTEKAILPEFPKFSRGNSESGITQEADMSSGLSDFSSDEDEPEMANDSIATRPWPVVRDDSIETERGHPDKVKDNSVIKTTRALGRSLRPELAVIESDLSPVKVKKRMPKNAIEKEAESHPVHRSNTAISPERDISKVDLQSSAKSRLRNLNEISVRHGNLPEHDVGDAQITDIHQVEPPRSVDKVNVKVQQPEDNEDLDSHLAQMLERVHAIKMQGVGMAREFTALESRITRYDGYVNKIINHKPH